MEASYGWKAALYLEKGHVFVGKGFGAKKVFGGEAVFNTGMSGYQEIITDPSYSNQIVVMTSVEIGNYGVNPEDIESPRLYLSGLVAREYFPQASNWRATQSLGDYLADAGVAGISDVDTRKITKILRDEGAQNSVIFPTEEMDVEKIRAEGRKLLEKVPHMDGLELVSQTSCKAPWEFAADRPKDQKSKGTVVVYDFGVKWHILRSFAERGFQVQVVPYNMPHQETMGYKPVAVCLSNGPGDPARVPHAVEQIQGLLGKVPQLAICMGHQLLARAVGGETFKLKFGHHGCNHPVQDLKTGRILITSQNHGFAVKEESLKSKDISLSLLNLNDRTVEGFTSEKMKFYSIQFHPEAKPGPSDANYLFDHFIKGFVR